MRARTRERWHATVLHTLAAAQARRAAEAEATAALNRAMASVEIRGGKPSSTRQGSGRATRAKSKIPQRGRYVPSQSVSPSPPKPKPKGANTLASSKSSSATGSGGGGSCGGDIAPKRGSRRGPPKHPKRKPPAWGGTRDERRERARIVDARKSKPLRENEWELPWPTDDGR